MKKVKSSQNLHCLDKIDAINLLTINSIHYIIDILHIVYIIKKEMHEIMKFVYNFLEGSKDMKGLLGGKGANLAEMTNLGLPIPAGFTITTDACLNYLANKNTLDKMIKEQVKAAINELEASSKKQFNATDNPLFVSVRSGAKFSMPGMMDTILNLGLNDESVVSLAEETGNEVFAYDCYGRLLKMFGEVVFSISRHHFDEQLVYLKNKKGYEKDDELKAEDLQQLIKVYKDIYVEVVHRPFPQSPEEQLFMAIEAVFRSWLNSRAKTYRELHQIPEDLGTAVNIQEMVFGNTGKNSGTGVAFTRNPATGEKGLFGEYLINAQGEDVVAGIRTPLPIAILSETMPTVYEQFLQIVDQLEKHYEDMQDIEFTIENQKLYILQTRNGKRTPKAAFQIATDLVQEGLITKETAVSRIDPQIINQLLHPVFTEEALKNAEKIAKGLPASPGAVTGAVYFDAESAKMAKEQGEDVILLRQETSPEDIEGMIVSEAIVTSRGGMTSHAAVVARGMGVCCVVGCESLKINDFIKQAVYNDGIISEGDIISVDGSSGEIYVGTLEKEMVEEKQSLNDLLQWADEIATMRVHANAETPTDIKTALSFGAKGIGLARTEHMFFGEERVLEMRKLILAQTSYERQQPLEVLKEYQKGDFKAIYREMKELPTTIRLLDPPLHEFLPRAEAEVDELAKELNISQEVINARIESLHETNPMLGHRGCRLAITYPEIYSMQVSAIVESALEVNEELNISIIPEIMIPLICDVKELEIIKAEIIQVIDQVFAQKKQTLAYHIGTMIEIPRACLTADEVAEQADFFSFGTNDLAQMVYGFSRDDVGKFMGEYVGKEILLADPFQTLDVKGVGALMQTAIEKGRKVKSELNIGVCGELGGDPESIKHFQEYGLTYVSCSPYRIPIARLAAAQAKLSAVHDHTD